MWRLRRAIGVGDTSEKIIRYSRDEQAKLPDYGALATDEEGASPPVVIQTFHEQGGGVRNQGLTDSDHEEEYQDSSDEDMYDPSYLGVPKVMRSMSSTIFMNDTRRQLDFVLAYQPQGYSASKNIFFGQYRLEFERKLKQQGLKLEYEGIETSQDGKTCFVKIHAPWDVLTRTAEINRVKMPIRVSDLPKEEATYDEWIRLACGRHKNPFKTDPSLEIQEPEYFTAAFSRDRAHQFLITDRSTFFKPAQRIRMVWDLILRTTIDIPSTSFEKGADAVGIKWLIKEGIYVAAFPLHDGDAGRDRGEEAEDGSRYPEEWPLRKWLFETWARPGQWFKYQPLNQIRNYYGEKVAVYFAWLGFYTRMLVFPAVVGFLCFFYGLSSHSADVPRRDVCDTTLATSNMTVCRLCTKKVCPFKPLSASCLYATLTYIFDNASTVFFAFFVSIWAVVFLELWKRYQAELSWDWDVMDIEFVEENLRPEYQAAVKTRRINPVTQEEEPYLPTRSKIQRVIASFATVLFMLFVVLGILAGIIFYRIVGAGLYYQIKDPVVKKISAPIMTSVTAAAINAVCILILGKLYERLAWLLTSNEFPRTETDFENSYTYKVFIFEFINYYAALFYIAFFKGKIFGPPNSNGYVDRCDPVGCLIDVCIQLAVIMIVKQIMSNMIEIGWPVLCNWWKRRSNVKETADNKYTRWEKDFDLSVMPELGLFDEYLEMIIQYGFVTMFVAAFPLAPLFALMNNVIEIRLDAYKITTQFRRPVPYRARDIGAWFTVLEIITKTAVITNGLVIAFTSDFIDRLVYITVYSRDGSLDGYVEYVFSVFNTSSWTNPVLRTDHHLGNVSTCIYRDYRNRPGIFDDGQQYTRTSVWWHVLVSRLFFVLVFEHVVFLIQGVVQYLIPDVPEHVHTRVQRQNYLAKQALYKHEVERVEFDVPLPEGGTGATHDGKYLDSNGQAHPLYRKPHISRQFTQPSLQKPLEPPLPSEARPSKSEDSFLTRLQDSVL